MPDSTLPAAPDATGLASSTENLNPTDIAFRPLVREDLATHDGDLLSQRFWNLFWHRYGNWRMSVNPKLLRAPLSLIYRGMFKAREWLCGISLPYTTIVGRRVCLEYFGGMILVPVSIGSDVTVRQNTTMGIPSSRARAARHVIEDHADIIGAGAVIIGDIPTGRGAIIGPNAVVTKSAPSYAVVVGVPGRVIRYGDRVGTLDALAGMS